MDFNEANKNVSRAIDELQLSSIWNGMNTTNKQEIAYCLAVISKQFHELRETYAKPVEMNATQRDLLLEAKEEDTFWVFANLIDDPETFEFYAFKNGQSMTFDDLMRAWLNPEVIKVVE